MENITKGQSQLIKVLSPQQYLDLIKVDAMASRMEDLFELRDSEIINPDLWDYPLEEYEEVFFDADTNEMKNNIYDHYALVLDHYGMIRIWEY